jgi:hypothetical protein
VLSAGLPELDCHCYGGLKRRARWERLGWSERMRDPFFWKAPRRPTSDLDIETAMAELHALRSEVAVAEKEAQTPSLSSWSHTEVPPRNRQNVRVLIRARPKPNEHPLA